MSYDQIYAEAIANGETPLFADLLASRQAPGAFGTDRAFMQGRNNNEDLDKMCKPLRDVMIEKAKRAGVSISGKTYISGLATEACDPRAWVSSNDEVKARCKKEGWVAEGNVKHKPSETPLAMPHLRKKEKEKRR